MTRDERIAAGYVDERSFRVRVRREGETGEWLASGQGGTIYAANRRDIAEEKAREYRACHECKYSYTVVQFVTWVKRPAPPPLKVGDEVVVRGKVTELDPGTEWDVRVGDVWVSSNLCERVKP